VRRIDPGHRTLGRFFDDEIAKPLGLDFYIGVPEAIPDARLAPLEPPSLWKRLTGMPLPLVLAAMNRRSVLYRSLIANPTTGYNTVTVRTHERRHARPTSQMQLRGRRWLSATAPAPCGWARLGARSS
jgi:hypothetical protein